MILQAAIHIGSSMVCTVIGCAEKNGSQSPVKIMAVGVAHTDAFRGGQINYRNHLSSAVLKSLQEATAMSNVDVHEPLLSFATPLMTTQIVSQKVQVASEDQRITAQDLHQAQLLNEQMLVAEDRVALQQCRLITYLDTGEEARDCIGLRSSTIDVFSCVMSVPNNSRQQLIDTVVGDNDKVAVTNTVFDGVAGAYYALTDHEKRQGVCYVDIGAAMTKVCVYNDGLLVFSECFDVGGETVDLDIAKECGIALHDADGFKRQEGTLTSDKYSMSSHVTYKKGTKNEKTMLRYVLNRVIEARYQSIFDMIFARLREADLYDRIDAGVVLAGGGARMDGLVGFLRARFDMPARMITTNPRLSVSTHLSDDNIKLLKQHLKDNTLHSAFGALLYAFSDEFAYEQETKLLVNRQYGWKDRLCDRLIGILSYLEKKF